MAEPLQNGSAPGELRFKRRFVVATVVFGLMILVLLWVAIAWRLSIERKNELHDSASSIQILADALEQHAMRKIHQVDQLTRFIKYEYEKNPRHFDLKRLMSSGIVPQRTLVLVSIINAQGDLIATTGKITGPVHLADREHFRVHINDPRDDLFISRPVRGRVSKKWVVQLTRRLNHPDGSFAGVVVVSEAPEYFIGDFYNNAALGRHGAIYLVNDDGTLLARTPALDAKAFTDATQGPHIQVTQGLSIRKDPFDGVTRMIAARHLNDYPLRVQAGLSVDEQLTDYFHLRRVYLILAGILSLALLAFVAAMGYLLRHLMRHGRELARLVEKDDLTGLPNRYVLIRTLQKALARGGSVGQLALLYIDIDNFKGVNDTLGHDAGDEVLCHVSQRFMDAIAPQDMLTRLSGDEFIILVWGSNVTQYAEQLAQRLIEALQSPFEVRGSAIPIHASIGIAFHTDHHETENDLLKKADLAMYNAKESGKSCIRVFTRGMLFHTGRLLSWERQIDTALARGEFFMSYQPILHLDSASLVGFEALIRWHHPDRGVIGAGEFIPIAEKTGQIVQIGELALTSACRQLAQWRSEFAVPLRLSVNVSSVQFWRTDMYDVVQRCLGSYGVLPQQLELEMTESVMIRNPAEVEAAIEKLKSLGVRIALDDFGTGYSSLAYLSRFAVDTLKLDRGFLLDVPNSKKACLMVSNIINIARILGIDLVIEGVETQAQRDWLRQFHGLQVQGFFYSPPADVEQIPGLVAKFGGNDNDKGDVSVPHNQTASRLC